MQPQDLLAHRKRNTSASYWTAPPQADLVNVPISKTSGRLARRHVALRQERVVSHAAAAWGAANDLWRKKDRDRLKDKTKDRADCNVNFSGFFWQGQWRWWSLDVSTVCHLTLPCWQWSKTCGTRRVLNNNNKKSQLLSNSTSRRWKASSNSTIHISQRESILSWLTLLNCLHSCFVCVDVFCAIVPCALFFSFFTLIINIFFPYCCLLSPFNLLSIVHVFPLCLTPPPNHTPSSVFFFQDKSIILECTEKIRWQ